MNIFFLRFPRHRGLNLYISSDGSIVERAYRYSNGVPDAEAWIHVVGVYESGTRQEVFINGVLSDGPLEGSIQSSYLENSEAFQIGRRLNGDGFQGMIDDVYIYNRPLSASEVLALANVPEPTTALLLTLGLAGLGMGRRVR